jgi:rhodanese-related sulfurtransferase/DNA-binding transcriptional ArsR family regulator
MSSDSPKRQLNRHLAGLARTLGHEHRLELIEHLGQGEKTVELLAQRTGIAFANVSQHLQQMRRAGLVAARRDGKSVYYRLADGPVIAAVSALRALAEHNLADMREAIRTYLTSVDNMVPDSTGELAGRLQDGTVILLDVRPEDEFRAGHLPGAVNIALEDLEGRLAELPVGRQIVAYCRGPYCVLSFQAASRLRASGFEARRLDNGFPEWKAAGHPVAAG